jgi:hypothetical protein
LYCNSLDLLTTDSPDFSIEYPDGIPIELPSVGEKAPIKYSYFIRRTKSSNLPVYDVAKHGGSMQITQIQHVEGDPRVNELNVFNLL